MTYLSKHYHHETVWLRKLGRTILILSTLFMARMFGEYQHNVWNGEFAYARYRWRGQDWAIPTGPMDEEE